MTRTHEVKTWPGPFQAMWDGLKLYEIRVDDRAYEPGDVFVSREWDPSPSGSWAMASGKGYTGRVIKGVIGYKTSGGSFGLPAHLCVLGISIVAKSEAP